MGNSGSSTEAVQSLRHPLLNSLILSKVFSHLNEVEDLNNVRHVCRLWWNMSLDKWRNLATRRLSLSKPGFNNVSCECYPPKPNQDRPRGEALDVDTFLQIMQNPTEQQDALFKLASKPYRHYRIENYSLANSDDDELDGLERLLRACGSHMKSLNVDHCFLHYDRYADFFTRILSKELINLEELTVTFSTVERSEGVACVEHVNETENKPKHVPTLLPRLKKLTVGRCENNTSMAMPTNEEWRDFFHYVPNLKELTVDAGASCSVLELLHPSVTGHPILLSKMTLTRNGTTMLSMTSTDGVWTVIERPRLSSILLCECDSDDHVDDP